MAMTALLTLLQGQLEEPKLGAVSAEQTNLNQIETDEKDYFKANGKYRQGEGIFDNYKYFITEYVGPKGAGYVVTLTKETATTVEEKRINYGPETQRSYDWRIISTATSTP